MLSFLSKAGNETGGEDARLPKPTTSVEHEQVMSAHSQVQLLDLSFTPEKVGARRFTEAF
jgi:hypothetical protein